MKALLEEDLQRLATKSQRPPSGVKVQKLLNHLGCGLCGDSTRLTVSLWRKMTPMPTQASRMLSLTMIR